MFSTTMISEQAEQHLSSMEERKSHVMIWFDKQINLEELFACAICHNPIDVDHPIHCPECSKLFCGDCIDQWLNIHSIGSSMKRCPCCQVEVDVGSFVYCRVYQDVNEMIDNLRNKLEELIRLVSIPLKACEEHGKELLLFCSACKKCICIKCLFSAAHKIHINDIVELDEARQKYKKMIENEHSFLANRLDALTKAGHQIAANESDMVDANESIIEDLNWAMEQIIDKVRDEMSERFRQQVEPVKAVTQQQMKEVKAVMRKAFELAAEETSPSVMMETFQMVGTIKKMYYEPVPALRLPKTEFVNPITPQFAELCFIIHGFSNTIRLNGQILSEQQSVEGYMLQLKGHQDRDENGNAVVKLSLIIVDGYNVYGVKVICYPVKSASVEPLARRMDLKLGEDNTVLEFSDFHAMEGFLEEKTDKLRLRMNFRLWATYYEKCVHKDWYIEKLTGVKQKKPGSKNVA
ncbi:E3 ubiquitin-protein ligase TRIM37-like [Toxorhynchites rutilus septentrionalis]|uniref:E3 ubiquitin-protein ligase TRIM37-like n=1 Tax=Toxorhynchites rutilus septentrionalis TaxID=329112 RepID=UPI002478CED9|nr:E3 ubiquitin-protein ligase TRIM37-like [Toxorhynchites rutilus septentrionalis]